MATSDTKSRILEAAERLFGERGIEGTSLRALTAEAGVNLAAVHYHFGSREKLVHEVLARRIVPINRERLRLLDKAEASAGGRPLEIEVILDCFVAPTLRLCDPAEPGGKRFLRTMARTMIESGDAIADTHAALFSEIYDRFANAIRRALPALDPRELAWRMRFTVGAMIHALMIDHRVFEAITRHSEAPDGDAMRRRLIAFVAAGLRASAAASIRPGRRSDARRKGSA